MSVATAQEAVAAALRRAIAERELRPGERVRQEEVARRLGVSVIPVREALRVLEGEGQLTYRARHGYVVAELDLGALREVYRLRELLEAEAVRAAVELAGEDTVEQVAAAFAQVDAAAAGERIADAMAANRRAHFLIFEAAGMPVLLRHLRMLWDSTEAYRALYYSDPARRTAVGDEHAAIVAALRARDGARLVALLDAHRGQALDALAAVLADGQTPG